MSATLVWRELPGLAQALADAGLCVEYRHAEGRHWSPDPAAAQAFIDAYQPPAAAAAERRISAVGFFERFTPAERLAMRSDPLLDDAERGAIAQGWVNLASPRLAALLARAVEIGALAPGRVAEILA